MYITVKQLANCINNCKRLTHYKVQFQMEGKKYPTTQFFFATDKDNARKQASDFLQEELEKGFYKSGRIISIVKFD